MVAKVELARFPSTCPHDCPSTCSLEVERVDARTIGRVYGARDNPYTAGVVCAKVGRYAERVHHPDRLSQPLIQRGQRGDRHGFEPISWDAALDQVAERLTLATQRHGAETVWPYYYAGTMGLVMRDGIERLRHVMGYSRQKNTICTALTDAGWLAGAGVKQGLDPREMAVSDLIVVWGGNPVNTQVNVMHHISQARRDRGAKLVVIDPYRTATAAKADIHLMPRPGTDAALACAVMQVLFTEGFADQAYLNRYTDVPQRLREHLLTRTPLWAAEITGIPAQQIIDFARLYGTTQRSFIRIGYGFARSRNGATSMHAVSCLPAVTGAWQYPGGGALYSNAAVYHIDSTMIKGLDALDSQVRVLDQSRIGPILTASGDDLGSGPPVTALFIQNTNPMVVAPDSLQVRAGFMRQDLFTCVHEQFMTETAAVADIVLPATTFLEHDDLYQGGGHTFLTVAKAIIEPHGEARSNHTVLCDLAARLGAEHPGFALSAWELIDQTLQASGHPDADEIYRCRWLDCTLEFDDMHFLNGFGHDDGKFHFQPDWSRHGAEHEAMPLLPDFLPVMDGADAARPFRLVTAPARSFLNSSFNETPSSRQREQQPKAKIHPDDCAALGLCAGEWLRLGNDQASVMVVAEPFPGLQPGVVIVEGLWDNAAFSDGIGINALTSADPGLPNGGAVFHDTAVWIERIDPANTATVS